ncbi:MAG: hypothetical protein IT367_09110 [Candidatus Hydrogenedentes bacterium]|nr:hypothetical protein [Candidatus Hydrogenedentota bacterium]
MAQATTFHQDYDSIFQSKSERAEEGTHSFEIDGIPQWYETDWYINGVYIERDEAGFLAIDPQITHTFGPGTYDIEGRVYTDERLYVKSRSWDFYCGPPDLVISEVATMPSYPLAGTAFKVYAIVENIGATSANAGPLRDQEIHFFFRGDFVGEDNYDNVPANAFVLDLNSSDIQHNQTGEFTIRAVADANDEVAEANENNNQKSETITIRGPDWLQVPNVQYDLLQEAKEALSDAGFSALVINYAFHEFLDEGLVISQTPWGPHPEFWVPPDDVPTITLTVSLGPSCTVKVVRPKKRQTWEIGSLQKIKWNTTGTCCDMVRLELWQNGEKLRTINNATPNDGKFNWLIAPERYAPGSKHQVRVFCDKHRNGFSKGRLRLVSN